MFTKCFSFLVISTLLFGCVENSYYSENPPLTEGSNGVVVTTSSSKTLSFEDAKNLKPGLILKLRLNRAGSEVKEYSVTFDGTYDMNGEHLIFCSTNEKLIVGQGDSGSPLLTQDGRVVGALCYGFENANCQFAARAIEDMVEIATTHSSLASGVGMSNSYQELGVVNYVIGLDSKCLDRYSSKHKSLYSANTQFPTNSQSSLKSTSNIVAISGNSIAVSSVRGDDYNLGAIGTISHFTADNKILAFGHGYGSGAIKPQTTLANMVTMIEASDIAFKLALPTSQVLGSMVEDTDNGILIDPVDPAKEFNHQVTINISGSLVSSLGSTISSNHKIANFWDSEMDINYASQIPAATVFNKVIQKGGIEIQASCTMSVTFENSEPLNTTFSVYSIYGDLDREIFYAIDNEFYKHLGWNGDNIHEFSIMINISDYNPEIFD